MNQDFVDLLRAFVAHDVRFLIVGAYALALHNRPRATGDLDVWVDATPGNAPRVLQALAAFGAPMAGIAEDDPSGKAFGDRRGGTAREVPRHSEDWLEPGDGRRGRVLNDDGRKAIGADAAPQVDAAHSVSNHPWA